MALREVGPGQTFSTIQAGVTAAAVGDTVNVHAGSYTEVVSINKSITVQNYAGDSPVLTGRLVPGSNVTLIGNNGGGTFNITGYGTATLGSYGIEHQNGTNVTITGFRIHDAFGIGVFARNCTRVTITNNTVDKMSSGNSNNPDGSGIVVISGRSTNATYANGIFVTNNTVTNCGTDGLQVHAQYITVSGNFVADNIHANWASQHPDGIQLNSGTDAGFVACQHVLVFNNVFRNHTQGIFTEGSTNALSDCSDIWIFNNIVYTTTGLTNGIDVSTLNTVGLMIKWSRNVHIFNNYIGRFGTSSNLGRGIHFQGGAAASIECKNNIIVNPGGYGIYYEAPSNCLIASGCDYNLYFNNIIAFNRSNANFWNTLAAIQAGSTFEDHGVFGNPLTNALPVPTLQAGSAAIDVGLNLTSLGLNQLDFDKANQSRPPGVSAWEIGPYEFIGVTDTTPPTIPTNLVVS